MSTSAILSPPLFNSTSLSEFDFQLKKGLASLSCSVFPIYRLEDQPHYSYFPSAKARVDAPTFIDVSDQPEFFKQLNHNPSGLSGQITLDEDVVLPPVLRSYFKPKSQVHFQKIEHQSKLLATLLIDTSNNDSKTDIKNIHELSEKIVPILEKIILQEKFSYYQEAKESWLEIHGERILQPIGFSSIEKFRELAHIIEDKLNFFSEATSSVNFYLGKKGHYQNFIPIHLENEDTNSFTHQNNFQSTTSLQPYRIYLESEPIAPFIGKPTYFLRFILEFASNQHNYLVEIGRNVNDGGFYNQDLWFLTSLTELLRQYQAEKQPLEITLINSDQTKDGSKKKGKAKSKKGGEKHSPQPTSPKSPKLDEKLPDESITFPNLTHWDSVDRLESFRRSDVLSDQIRMENFSLTNDGYLHYQFFFDPTYDHNEVLKLVGNTHLQERVADKPAEVLPGDFLNSFQSKTQEILRTPSFPINNYFLLNITRNDGHLTLHYLFKNYQILLYQFESGEITELKGVKDSNGKETFSKTSISLLENDLIIINNAQYNPPVNLTELAHDLALVSYLNAHKIADILVPDHFSGPGFFELIKAN